jgi:hypothetical protein
MIFQNPMATFNPVLTIGYQIAEPLRQLHGYNRKDAEHEAVRLLERMQIADARQSKALAVCARIFRWHAAARSHRHGLSLQTGIADCRRTHHRTGCVHASMR